MGGACGTSKKKNVSAESNTSTESLKSLSHSLAITGRYHRPPKKLEEDYSVTSTVLGTGYNGSVFQAKGKKDRPGTYAVKGFCLQGIEANKKADLRREVEIFLAMDHPHVARLVDVYEDATQLYLVMECMEGGELFERVQKLKTFSEKDAAHAVWQMLLAVNYLHRHDVVHRDLKLENFLFERQDNDHLKLIDFGFSKVYEADTKMELSCGTLAYVAPEVLFQSYTSQCDLWSMGVIAFILLLGYMPFSGTDEKQKNLIMQGQYKKKQPHWDRISSLSRSFISALMEVDPLKRLTAEQALKHPWIAKRDQSGHRYVTPIGEIEKDPNHAISVLNVDEMTVGALCAFAQASRFRRACMSLMAWSLTPQERSQVRDAFIELDTHREGTISLEELRRVLMEKFELDPHRSEQVVESLAVTNRDCIHYSEFLAAMVSTRISLNENHFAATFRRFDTENKGFLTNKDFSLVLGDSFSNEEINQVVEAMEANASGEIAYDQFVKYLKGDGHLDFEDALTDDQAQDAEGSQGVAERKRTLLKSATDGLADKNGDDLARIISSVQPGGGLSEKDRLLSKQSSDAKSRGCSLQ